MASRPSTCSASNTTLTQTLKIKLTITTLLQTRMERNYRPVVTSTHYTASVVNNSIISDVLWTSKHMTGTLGLVCSLVMMCLNTITRA